MNIYDIKQNNRLKIYLYVRKNELATRQDIVLDLQLSLPTVTQNLEYLLKQGLISSECKVANKAGGRNPVAYSCSADAKVAVGLYITKHHVKASIVDLNGNVLKRINKRQDYQRNDEYFRLLGETVESIMDSVKLEREKILGVGIALQHFVDCDEKYAVQGGMVNYTEMNCEELSKYISYPVKLIRDSYASGFSEIWMSSEMRNAFYINLCESVGGSVILNDTLYLGDGLYSGEVGHLNLVSDGEQCFCGQTGCFDAYCNANVLANNAECNLDLFFQRLKQGEGELQKVWDKYLNNLATAVHNIRMLFGCKVIIGGRVGAYMKDHMDALCEKVDAKSPFGESAVNYLIECRNKMDSEAKGAALLFVKEFINDIC